ncbi:MAG TPA: SGNH/GDSL hydrolase family protein [Cyclobacteriaceae bacterium]|nr:SGNH/GDSL hydrolase family protein [Cyclobacteriaceae bacterium]
MVSFSSAVNRRQFIGSTLSAGSALFLGNGPVISQKKIALIGDSVRAGYQPDVSNYLITKASVWGPEESGLNSIDILQNLGEWIRNAAYDIIHINSGLNDLRTTDFQSVDNLVPIDYYAKNVERIIKAINRYSPGSVIVWATITPVIDVLFNTFHQERMDYRMKNEDVIRYNEAAMKVAGRLGVALNDLYAYLMSGDPSLVILDDGVHYTGYGYQLIAERVTGILEKIIEGN